MYIFLRLDEAKDKRLLASPLPISVIRKKLKTMGHFRVNYYYTWIENLSTCIIMYIIYNSSMIIDRFHLSMMMIDHLFIYIAIFLGLTLNHITCTTLTYTVIYVCGTYPATGTHTTRVGYKDSSWKAHIHNSRPVNLLAGLNQLIFTYTWGGG
jgi:hypothetical protein